MGKRPYLLAQLVSDIGLQALNIDEELQNVTENTDNDEMPRNRVAISEGPFARSQSICKGTATCNTDPPRRSKARTWRLQTESNMVVQEWYGTGRPTRVKKKLWHPENDMELVSISAQKFHTPKSRNVPQPSAPRATRGEQYFQANQKTSIILGQKPTPYSHNAASRNSGSYEGFRRPETRPISQEQLIAEVKGIYASLVMVEAKCIEVGNNQSTLANHDKYFQSKLNNEQWQALMALHRTLLNEQHDFFLASQHPSTSPALCQLASKYAMPARMWRHGIHSLLELLRKRLPTSLDHMRSFIYLAYSMMPLLYETVPSFEDTWIECFGDLDCYRMAIEDDNTKDREAWTGVARHWYSKFSDKNPTTGRLYHHLAILARPNALQQLFYYAKSFCVVNPFTSAKESILPLFAPVLTCNNSGTKRLQIPHLLTELIKAYERAYKYLPNFRPAVQNFLSLLDYQRRRVTCMFMEQWHNATITKCVTILSSASNEENPVRNTTSPADEKRILSYEKARQLHNTTLEIISQRLADPNVLPFIHVILVFLQRISHHVDVVNPAKDVYPWEVVVFLPYVARKDMNMVQGGNFPIHVNDNVPPPVKGNIFRDSLCTDHYFPDKWIIFMLDKGENYQELASTIVQQNDKEKSILYILLSLIETSVFFEKRLDYARPLHRVHLLRHTAFAKDYSLVTGCTTIADEKENCLESTCTLDQKKKRGYWFSSLVYSLQIASSAIIGTLKFYRYTLCFLVFKWFPITLAAPIAQTSQTKSTGLPVYFQEFWRHFAHELAGPLVFNTALVAIASICYLCFTSHRLAFLMPYAQGGTSISTFYAGFNDELSSYQLAGCCIFTYVLSHRYLSDKTSNLPASRGIIRISIITLSLLLSLTTAYFAPTIEGRYSNWQVAGGIASLPVTSFLMWAWVTLFLDTGLAARIEEYLKRMAGVEETRSRHSIVRLN